jgi:hypothetical protein
MKYLKLTNVDPSYKEGGDIVINLDNIEYFQAVSNFGVRVYSTTTEYDSSAGDYTNAGFISVSGADAAGVLNMVKEINAAITGIPGGPVISLHTTLQVSSFSFGT